MSFKRLLAFVICLILTASFFSGCALLENADDIIEIIGSVSEDRESGSDEGTVSLPDDVETEESRPAETPAQAEEPDDDEEAVSSEDERTALKVTEDGEYSSKEEVATYIFTGICLQTISLRRKPRSLAGQAVLLSHMLTESLSGEAISGTMKASCPKRRDAATGNAI